jgi:hypothetical protein
MYIYQSKRPITISVNPEFVPEGVLFRSIITFKAINLMENRLGKGNYTTDKQWEIDSIESHKLFKSGWIERLATPEEQAQANRDRITNETLKAYDGIPINYDKLKKKEIKELAEKLQVESTVEAIKEALSVVVEEAKNYEDMNFKDLQAEAKALGISSFGLSKDKLIEALNEVA